MNLRREQLVGGAACAEGLAFFDANWPSGEADIQEVADARTRWRRASDWIILSLLSKSQGALRLQCTYSI